MMELLGIDTAEIFKLTVSPFELILRGTVMYWFLFAIFRFILRRDIGSVGVTDFLFVVILGDAAQNAMIGEATSASDGMVLISVLVFWNYLLDFLAYHFPAFEKFTTARRLVIYKDKKYIRKNMRCELITKDEIDAKVHEEGLKDLSNVKEIYMEPDGELSIIKYKD